MINTNFLQIKHQVWVFQVDNRMKQQIWYHVKAQLSPQELWETCYKIRHQVFYD